MIAALHRDTKTVFYEKSMYKMIEIKRAFLSFYHILKVGGLIENNNIKKDKVKKLTQKNVFNDTTKRLSNDFTIW